MILFLMFFSLFRAQVGKASVHYGPFELKVGKSPIFINDSCFTCNRGDFELSVISSEVAVDDRAELVFVMPFFLTLSEGETQV
jgi:hypothetical protein